MDDIKKYILDWGFSGIKLMPLAGYYPSDPELMYPIYKLCVDLDAIVCINSSHSCWHKARLLKETPLQIDEIAQDFPDLKIHILCGGERRWRHLDAIGVCLNSRNVCLDTSPALPELWTSYINVPDEFRLAATMIPDNMMYASEYPYCFPITRGVDGIDSIEGVSEEFKNKLFYENAKRFYGFEV